MNSIICNCVISHNEGGLGIFKLVLSLKLACMVHARAKSREEIARATRQRVNCANSGLNLCEMVFACSLSLLSDHAGCGLSPSSLRSARPRVHPSHELDKLQSIVYIYICPARVIPIKKSRKMAALYIYKKIAGSAHLIALRSCQQSTLGLFILRMRGAQRGSLSRQSARGSFPKRRNCWLVRPSVHPRALDPRQISVTELLVPAAIIYQKRKKIVSMNLMEISSTRSYITQRLLLNEMVT